MTDLIRVDAGARRAWAGDREIHNLTRTEFDLLHLLARNAGRVVTYQQFAWELWRGVPIGDIIPSLRAHIGRIRPKIGENPKNPRHIRSVSGVGYRFACPELADVEPDRRTALANDLDALAAQCQELTEQVEVLAAMARTIPDSRPAPAGRGADAGRAHDVQDRQGVGIAGDAALVLGSGRAEASVDSARPTGGES